MGSGTPDAPPGSDESEPDYLAIPSTQTPTATPTVTPTPIRWPDYDLNRDGEVNGADLLLLRRRIAKDDLQSDFNYDSHVDSADLTLFAHVWYMTRLLAAPDPESLPDYDLNGDGEVNAEDLFLIYKDMRENNRRSDFNFDGQTDFTDFVLFLRAWNTTAPMHAALTQTPTTTLDAKPHGFVKPD